MEIDRFYATGDVARLFRVSTHTVRRWARQGKLGVEVRTPGNHRRYRADFVDKLLLQDDSQQALAAYQEASNAGD